MSHAKVCLAIFLVSTLAACSDSTAPNGRRDDIRGRVVDVRGRPVAGATVVLQYSIDPPPIPVVDKVHVMLRFQLPEASPVSVWVSSYCDADTVRRLITADLPAGEHAADWDGRDEQGRLLPEGVYWFHLSTATVEERDDFLLMELGYVDIAGGDSLVPLAVADGAGQFTLDQRCLSIGHTFPQYGLSGSLADSVEISRNVRVWAFSATDSSRAPSEWVYVDPQRGAEVEISLGR